MADRYKGYPEYKASGSFWFDEIPLGWNKILLKRVVDAIKDGTHGTYPRISNGVPFLSAKNVFSNGIQISENESQISLEHHNEIVRSGFPKLGDLLITCVGTVGRTFVYDRTQPLAFQRSVAFVRLNKNAFPQYYKYYVESKPYQSQLRSLIKASAQGGVYMGDLVATESLLPPYVEQQKIANFLDHETVKIDTLIAKQEKLIELLKEKRQAVISHAVTKGISSINGTQCPMKDSGVEWLGEVPEHWDVTPLKYLCSFSGGGTPTKDNLSYWTNGTVPWVSPKDMKSQRVTQTSDYITDTAVMESSTNYVDSGALLMVVRSGILQRTIPVAINNVIITLNQDMKALKFNLKMTVEFALQFIVGNEKALLLEWSKEGATVESIEHEYLSNGSIPVPPMEEQLSITQYLSVEMDKFSKLEEKAGIGITLLKERKTALISAAVTGKIDVRDWAVLDKDQG